MSVHATKNTTSRACREVHQSAKLLTGSIRPETVAVSLRLSKAIAASGWTQSDVADALGVSEAFISQCCSETNSKTLGHVLREQMLHACPPVARELARLELEDIEPARPSGLRPLQHVARLAEKVGPLAAAGLEIEADGKVDERDAPKLIEMKRGVEQVRMACDSAERDINAALCGGAR